MDNYSVFRRTMVQKGVDSYVLLSRPPLSDARSDSLDLHISGTPPTFILSQDQTLKKSGTSLYLLKESRHECRDPNPFNETKFSKIGKKSTMSKSKFKL